MNEPFTKKYRVAMTVTREVWASDEASAISDAIDRVFGEVEREEVIGQIAPYACALPGAERWAAAAEKIRFGEDCKIAASTVGDRAWWWTNGHVMLLCNGVPPDGYEVRDCGPVVSDDKPRRATAWCDLEVDCPIAFAGTEMYRDPHYAFRRASVDELIAVDPTYVSLVESCVPSCTWWVGSTVEVPFHVRDAHGALVAVVMGRRVSPREP